MGIFTASEAAAHDRWKTTPPDDDDVICPRCKGEGTINDWPLDDVRKQCYLCEGSLYVPREIAREYHREEAGHERANNDAQERE
jgi:DnaJ-class molecular chaperone